MFDSDSSRSLPLQHCLVAALCLGLALANALRIGVSIAAIAALALIAGMVASRQPGSRFFLTVVLFVLFGLALGSLRLSSLDRSPLTAHIGEAARALVVVTGPPRVSSYAVSAVGQVERFGREPLREQVWLRLPAGKKPPIGAVLELSAKVELPAGPSASGFDQRAWLARQGIHVVLRSGPWRRVGRRGGIGGFGDRLRERLAHDLVPGLRGERRGLVLGFVLGEDEGLSKGLRQSFRRSGLYHLLAVSGQNIAFLVAGVLGLAWLCGMPRRFGEVLALATIAAYVLVVGWQPSVVRAAVAGALASLAWLAARPRDRWYFLLLGALTLLVWNPRSLFDPGFQLSFAAVVAIFVTVRPLERLLEKTRLPAFLRPAVAVSAGCTLMTTPIMLFQFGKVPVYGVLANIAVEPVVPLVLFLGLGCVLVAPLAPPAAYALSFLNGLFAAYIAFWARLVGALPGAQANRAQLLRLCLLAFFLALWPFLLKPRPPRFVVLTLTALIPLWGWQNRPQLRQFPAPPAGLRITFLDVGEGDSTLLQTRQGAVLVDAGPPEAGVAAQLRRLGVERIEALVLSHPHRDHVGGAADVLRKLQVGLVLDSGLSSSGGEEQAALDEARRRGVSIRPARAGQELRLGKLRLRILSPKGDPTVTTGDANEAAVVSVASYGSTDLLLPADAESLFTLPLITQPLEVYKVAHHGSADDGLPQLLDRLQPQIAVISVGTNDYGHPTPSTLATLAAEPGLNLFRTDQSGRVILESDGCAVTVRAQHAQTVFLACG
ncbi:MAG TPA: ComEC/Rec2 family competence protein [Gaiellaceae bacterium]